MLAIAATLAAGQAVVTSMHIGDGSSRRGPPWQGSLFGGTRISIVGTQFDTVNRQYYVRIGKTGSAGSNCMVQPQLCSSTLLVCETDPPPSGLLPGPQPVTVWEDAWMATMQCPQCFFLYSSSSTPRITSVSPASAMVGAIITVVGENFDDNYLQEAADDAEFTIGSDPSTAAAKNGGLVFPSNRCPLVEITNVTAGTSTITSRTFTCILPPAIPAGTHAVRLRFTALGLAAPSTAVVTVYPALAGVSPAVSSLQGGLPITVFGGGFGRVPSAISVAAYGVPCTVAAAAESSLVCVTGAAGAGHNYTEWLASMLVPGVARADAWLNLPQSLPLRESEPWSFPTATLLSLPALASPQAQGLCGPASAGVSCDMRVRAMVKPVLGAGAYAFNLTLAPLARGAAIPSGAWAELWVDGPAASLPSERRLSPSRLVARVAAGDAAAWAVGEAEISADWAWGPTVELVVRGAATAGASVTWRRAGAPAATPWAPLPREAMARWATTGFNLSQPSPLEVYVSGVRAVVDDSACRTGGCALSYRGDAYPLVSRVTPASGAAGTLVVVEGAGFAAGMAVTIGGAPCAQAAAPTATTYSCYVGLGAAAGVGPVAAVVPTQGGAATSRAAFTVVPTVTVVAPAAGATTGLLPVTISGSGLASAALGAVRGRFGATLGPLCGAVAGGSSTQVVCPAAPGAAGVVDVGVEVRSAVVAEAALAVAYAPPSTLAVTGVAPSALPASGGYVVTVVGSGFDPPGGGAVAVQLGPYPCAVLARYPGVVKCVAPNVQQAGTLDVRVSLAGGAAPAVLPRAFTYLPTVWAVTPAAVGTNGGSSITIKGAGLAYRPGAVVVKVGTADCPLTAASSTQLECSLPPRPATAPPPMFAETFDGHGAGVDPAGAVLLGGGAGIDVARGGAAVPAGAGSYVAARGVWGRPFRAEAVVRFASGYRPGVAHTIRMQVLASDPGASLGGAGVAFGIGWNDTVAGHACPFGVDGWCDGDPYPFEGSHVGISAAGDVRMGPKLAPRDYGARDADGLLRVVLRADVYNSRVAVSVNGAPMGAVDIPWVRAGYVGVGSPAQAVLVDSLTITPLPDALSVSVDGAAVLLQADVEYREGLAPNVSAVSATALAVGGSFCVSGAGLNSTAGGGSVDITLGGVPCAPATADAGGARACCVVPPLPGGALAVRVAVDGRGAADTSALPAVRLVAPTVTALQGVPTTRVVSQAGALVTVVGSGFVPATTRVAFGTSACAVRVAASTGTSLVCVLAPAPAGTLASTQQLLSVVESGVAAVLAVPQPFLLRDPAAALAIDVAPGTTPYSIVVSVVGGAATVAPDWSVTVGDAVCPTIATTATSVECVPPTSPAGDSLVRLWGSRGRASAGVAVPTSPPPATAAVDVSSGGGAVVVLRAFGVATAANCSDLVASVGAAAVGGAVPQITMCSFTAIGVLLPPMVVGTATVTVAPVGGGAAVARGDVHVVAPVVAALSPLSGGAPTTALDAPTSFAAPSRQGAAVAVAEGASGMVGLAYRAPVAGTATPQSAFASGVLLAAWGAFDVVIDGAIVPNARGRYVGGDVFTFVHTPAAAVLRNGVPVATAAAPARYPLYFSPQAGTTAMADGSTVGFAPTTPLMVVGVAGVLPGGGTLLVGGAPCHTLATPPLVGAARCVVDLSAPGAPVATNRTAQAVGDGGGFAGRIPPAAVAFSMGLGAVSASAPAALSALGGGVVTVSGLNVAAGGAAVMLSVGSAQCAASPTPAGAFACALPRAATPIAEPGPANVVVELGAPAAPQRLVVAGAVTVAAAARVVAAGAPAVREGATVTVDVAAPAPLANFRAIVGGTEVAATPAAPTSPAVSTFSFTVPCCLLPDAAGAVEIAGVADGGFVAGLRVPVELAIAASAAPAGGYLPGGAAAVVISGSGARGVTRATLADGSDFCRVDPAAAAAAGAPPNGVACVVVPRAAAPADGDATVALGLGAAGQAATFPVRWASGGPAVTGVSPPVVAAGGVVRAVTVTGSGFGGAVGVLAGGVMCDSFTVDAAGTTAVCTLAATTLLTAGPLRVVPLMAAGGAATATAFAYVPLVVTALSPASVPPAGGSVEVLGAGFSADLAANRVVVGGRPVTVLERRPTGLLVLMPPSPGGGAGVVAVDVTVLSAEAVAAAPAPAAFTYRADLASSLSAISASSGPAGGGTVLTLTGAGLLGGASGAEWPAVAVGDAVCAVRNATATSVVCVTPLHPAAPPAAVVVTVPGRGVAQAAFGATFEFAFSISTVAPAVGSTQGGTPITIRGVGLVADGADVAVQLVAAAGTLPCAIVSRAADAIVCRTPPAPVAWHAVGAATDPLRTAARPGDGAADVVVVVSRPRYIPAAARAVPGVRLPADEAVRATCARCFTFQHTAAVVAAVSPASLAPGALLSVSGSGFPAGDAASVGAVVEVGGAPCVVEGAVTATALTCRLSANATAAASARVRVAFAAGDAAVDVGCAGVAGATLMDCGGRCMSDADCAVPSWGVTSCAQLRWLVVGNGLCESSPLFPGAVVALPGNRTLDLSCPMHACEGGDCDNPPDVSCGADPALAVAVTATASGVAPAAVSLNGGVVITISGAGLAPAAVAAAFGGVPCVVDVRASTPTAVLCRVSTPLPAGTLPLALALGGVPVGCPACALTASAAATPTVSGVAGVWNGAAPVAITGALLDAPAPPGGWVGTPPTPAVKVGGVVAAVVSASATTLMVLPPPMAAGTYPLTVEVAGRGIATATSVTVPLVLASVSPSVGSLAGGAALTVVGSGFDPAATVVMAGGTTLPITGGNSTTLLLRAPPSAATAALTVSATAGAASAGCAPAACTFQWAAAATPTVTSVSPSAPTPTVPYYVSVFGSGFGTDAGAVAVTVGGTACRVTAVVAGKVDCTLSGAPAGVAAVGVVVAPLGAAVVPPSATVTLPLVVSGVTPQTGSAGGYSRLFVQGVGFPPLDTPGASLAVTVGGSLCPVVEVAATGAFCVTQPPSPGVAPTGDVVVSVVRDGAVLSSALAPPPAPLVDVALGRQARGYGGVDFRNATDGVDATAAVTAAAAAVWVEVDLGAAVALQRVDVAAPAGGPALPAFQLLGAATAGGSFAPLFPTPPPSRPVRFVRVEAAAGGAAVRLAVAALRAWAPASAAVVGVFSYVPSAGEVAGLSRRYGSTAGGSRLELRGTGLGRVSRMMLVSRADAAVVVECPLAAGTPPTPTLAVCVTLPPPPGTVRDAMWDVVAVTADEGAARCAGDVCAFKYMDAWSALSTWGGLPVPQAGDSVAILPGQVVLLDVSPPPLVLVLVQGTLLVSPDVDIELTADYVLVHGGTLSAGTDAAPHPRRFTVTLTGDATTPEIPVFGAKVLALRGGTLELHGLPATPTWTQLAATAPAGATTVRLRGGVSWAVGDVVVLASTSFEATEAEERVITSVSAGPAAADGTPEWTDVGLNAGLDFAHEAAPRECYDTADGGRRCLDLAGEVGVLTRSIVVQGDAASQALEFGATTMLMPMGDDDGHHAHIENVEFRRCGQRNRLGRYCTHFHMAGRLSQSYIRGSAMHHSVNRAVAVHGVHELSVENNVAYDVRGHTFFVEDGIETRNRIVGNLAVLTRPSSSLLNTDTTPASFWITNPNNVVVGNRAAGSANYGFWYRGFPHPTGPSATDQICPVNTPLGEFRDNVAHSNGKYGLRIFQNYAPLVDGAGCSGRVPAPATFANLTAWRNRLAGVAMGHDEVGVVGHVRIVGLVAADNGHPDAPCTTKVTCPSGVWVERTLTAGSGIKVKPPWGDGDGPGVYSSVLIGHTAGAGNITTLPEWRWSNARRIGVGLPMSNNFLVANTTFVNYFHASTRAGARHEHFAIEAAPWASRMSLCNPFAFEADFEGLRFVRAPERVRLRFIHHGTLNDRDGSLTGRAGDRVPAQAVHFSPLLDPRWCEPAPLLGSSPRMWHCGPRGGGDATYAPVRRVSGAKTKLDVPVTFSRLPGAAPGGVDVGEGSAAGCAPTGWVFDDDANPVQVQRPCAEVVPFIDGYLLSAHVNSTLRLRYHNWRNPDALSWDIPAPYSLPNETMAWELSYPGRFDSVVAAGTSTLPTRADAAGVGGAGTPAAVQMPEWRDPTVLPAVNFTDFSPALAPPGGVAVDRTNKSATVVRVVTHIRSVGGVALVVNECPPGGCPVSPAQPQSVNNPCYLWSDPLSWARGADGALLGRAPRAGEDVVIAPGVHVCYDEAGAAAAPVLGTLTVSGRLTIAEYAFWNEPGSSAALAALAGAFDPSAGRTTGPGGDPLVGGPAAGGAVTHTKPSKTLRALNIVVNGGAIFCGDSPSAPYPPSRRFEIELSGHPSDSSPPFGPRTLGILFGRVRLFGAAPAVPWARLSRNAAAGATTLEVDAAPAALAAGVGWGVGARLAVLPSGREMLDVDTVTVVSVAAAPSGGGSVVTFSPPLRAARRAEFPAAAVLADAGAGDLRPVVASLSRNVLFAGPAAAAAAPCGIVPDAAAATDAATVLSGVDYQYPCFFGPRVVLGCASVEGCNPRERSNSHMGPVNGTFQSGELRLHGVEFAAFGQVGARGDADTAAIEFDGADDFWRATGSAAAVAAARANRSANATQMVVPRALSRITGCSFSSAFSGVVRGVGSPGVGFESNVVVGAWNDAVTFGDAPAIVRDNVAALVRPTPAGCPFRQWSKLPQCRAAAFRLGPGVVAERNVAAGAHVYGFATSGVARAVVVVSRRGGDSDGGIGADATAAADADFASAAPAWAANEAVACRVGAILTHEKFPAVAPPADAGPPGVTLLAGVRVRFASEIGLLSYKLTGSVDVVKCAAVGCLIGAALQHMTPPGQRLAVLRIAVNDSAFVGSEDLTTCPPSPLVTYGDALTPLILPREAAAMGVGAVGILLSGAVDAVGDLKGEPMNRMFFLDGFPHADAAMTIANVSFAGFPRGCAAFAAALANSWNSNDTVPHTRVSRVRRHASAEVATRWLRHGVGPSQWESFNGAHLRGDTSTPLEPGDGAENVVVEDVDGTFLGGAAPAYSTSAYMLATNADAYYPDATGLIPLPIPQVSHTGLASLPGVCSASDPSAEAGYVCSGLVFRPLVFESFDEDADTRRLAPFTVCEATGGAGDAVIDAAGAPVCVGRRTVVQTGPLPHPEKLGRKLQIRLSRFTVHVAVGRNYTVAFAGTNPRYLRITPTASWRADEQVVLRIRYSNPERLTPVVAPLDPAAAPLRQRSNWGFGTPPGERAASDVTLPWDEVAQAGQLPAPLTTWPTVGHPVGTHYLDRGVGAARMRQNVLHLVVGGGAKYVEVQQDAVVFVSMTLALPTEAFFSSPAFIAHLAFVLAIPPERIRIPIIVPGSIVVQIEVVDDPAVVAAVHARLNTSADWSTVSGGGLRAGGEVAAASTLPRVLAAVLALVRNVTAASEALGVPVIAANASLSSLPLSQSPPAGPAAARALLNVFPRVAVGVAGAAASRINAAAVVAAVEAAFSPADSAALVVRGVRNVSSVPGATAEVTFSVVLPDLGGSRDLATAIVRGIVTAAPIGNFSGIPTGGRVVGAVATSGIDSSVVRSSFIGATTSWAGGALNPQHTHTTTEDGAAATSGPAHCCVRGAAVCLDLGASKGKSFDVCACRCTPGWSGLTCDRNARNASAPTLPPRGLAAEYPARDCRDVALCGGGAARPSGLYWVQDAAGAAVQAWCDMDVYGGGWTVTVNVTSGSAGVDSLPALIPDVALGAKAASGDMYVRPAPNTAAAPLTEQTQWLVRCGDAGAILQLPLAVSQYLAGSSPADGGGWFAVYHARPAPGLATPRNLPNMVYAGAGGLIFGADGVLTRTFAAVYRGDVAFGSVPDYAWSMCDSATGGGRVVIAYR